MKNNDEFTVCAPYKKIVDAWTKLAGKNNESLELETTPIYHTNKLGRTVLKETILDERQHRDRIIAALKLTKREMAGDYTEYVGEDRIRNALNQFDYDKQMKEQMPNAFVSLEPAYIEYN